MSNLTRRFAALFALAAILFTGLAAQAAETYTAASYVQAGLVSQWDAIDNQATGTHDPSAKTWEALKGGVKFTLNGNATWTENGLSFPGDTTSSSYAKALSTDEGFAKAFPGGVAKTVEVVVTPNAITTANRCAVFGPNLALHFNGTTSVIPTSNAGKAPTYAVGVANLTETFSTVYSTADKSTTLRRNGVSVANAGSARVASTGPVDVWLGCAGKENSSPYNGTVHALRIYYNPQLSADGAAHNAAVDSIRFKGTDPETAFRVCGVRLREDGLYEYFLSVEAGEDGLVRVTANGSTEDDAKTVALWLTNGTPVEVEYIPNAAGDWRFLSGAPVGTAYPTPSLATFTMPGKKIMVEAIPYPYSDENVFSALAPTSVTTNYDAAVVYAYPTPTDTFSVFAKKTVTYEELDGSAHVCKPDDRFLITPSGPSAVWLTFGDNTARRFAFDPFDSYPIVDDAAHPEPVISLNGTQLEKGTDYDLDYENETVPGEATMFVVGKSGTEYEGLVQRYGYLAASVRYVTPDGTGDGSDWAHPMAFTNAVAGLASESYEIWCRAGTYALTAALTVPNYTAIRGGFAGDDVTDVLKRAPNGAKAVFDGGGTLAKLFNVTYNCPVASLATRPIAFADCVFTHCTGRAVGRGAAKTTTSTSLSFKRCDFLNNAAASADGIACYTYNANAAARADFLNCRFEGNMNKAVAERSVIYAYAATVTIDSCLFITNGAVWTDYASANNRSPMVSLYSCGGNSKIVNCDFRGNAFTRASSSSGQYFVYVNNTKAVIENCRFVGNRFYGGYHSSQPRDGILYVDGGSASTPVAVRNCTFAYNSLCGGLRSGVHAGSSCIRTTGASPVAVENCIFWQNVQEAGNISKRDFQGSNATLTYSLFAELETAGACVSVKPGAGCFTDDPLFVTTNSVEDFIFVPAAGTIALNPAKLNEILAIDVHLRSTEGYRKNGDATWYKSEAELSSAIDKGNPAADYSNEPTPNGKRLNAGGYGNTAEASKTPSSAPAIVSVTADFPDGLTQPRFTMAVGGEGMFVGTVQFFVSTDGGTTYVASDPVGGASPGASVSWSAPFFAERDATLTYYAKLSVAGADPLTSLPAETTVTGAKPPWEKPGDVALVTPEGTPEGSGQSWENAMDIATAVANLTKYPGSEIWLKAGAHMMTNGQIGIYAPGKFLGGFAGDDPKNLAKRAANGEKSVLDGAGTATSFFRSYYSGSTAVTFEDCVFTHCAGSVFYALAQETPFTFTRCDFLYNSASASGGEGIAFHIASGSFAPVSFTNCRFEGNMNKSGSSTPYSVIYAHAATVTIDSCLFVTNGTSLSKVSGGSYSVTPMVTLDACGGGSKIVNCDCRGNAGYRYTTAQKLVYINGTKATIERCRFVGNQFYVYAYASTPNDGIIFVDGGSASTPVTIRNCTFAYNTLDGGVRNSGSIINGSSCIYTTGASPVAVENCIFWQNIQNTLNTAKRDFHGSNATLTYSLFADLDPAGKCVNVQPGEDCIAGDPLFETKGSISNYLNAALLASGRVAFDVSKIDEILAINVHLSGTGGYVDERTGEKVKGHGKSSPCINKGNPESDWSQEPVPNGKRINMGGYGGTPWATCSPSGGALFIR